MTTKNRKPEQICPLCGGDNQCAMASELAVENCWCVAVSIPPEILASVPEEAVGKRCICPRCAGMEGGTGIER